MRRVNETAPSTETPERLVLYVEDEPANWEVTELRLRKRFKLLWARTAREACELVREHNAQFHAVLMDIQLKGSDLDGVSLTRALRHKTLGESLPDYARLMPKVECPIFFVTAYGNLHTPSEMVQAGGDDIVPKPVDFLKLSNLLVTTHAKRALNSLTR